MNRRTMEKATLDQIADILVNSQRIGAEKDSPEGTRYIQLSDTMADMMQKRLRAISAENHGKVNRLGGMVTSLEGYLHKKVDEIKSLHEQIESILEARNKS